MSLLRVAALAVLTLAACSENKPPAETFDFSAYGDCRDDHAVHRRICASILRMNPKFVVVSGDLVGFGGNEDDWKEFRDVTRDLRSKAGYFPAPGNHDVSSSGAFEKEFGLGKRYYDKRVGNVHLFLLDSTSDFSDQDQFRWLENTAKASDARHKIAAFHHPPFSIDAYGESEAKAIRARIHDLLVRLKFCAAFCGHHHAFYATRRDGVRYVVTAGGGAPLYEIKPAAAEKGDLFRMFHHFIGCRVSEKGISARVYDPDGKDVPELGFPLCEHP